MGKKRGAKSKGVEVDVSEFIGSESVMKTDAEVITISSAPQQDSINYEEYFGTTPPFFLFFIDYSKQLTAALLTRVLTNYKYEAFEQEKSTASCFRVQFETLDDLKKAHKLDQSTVNGKSLYVSFVSADKLDELKSEQRYNTRNERSGAFTGSLNFRSGGDNSNSFSDFRNTSDPNGNEEPLSFSNFRNTQTSGVSNDSETLNISSIRSGSGTYEQQQPSPYQPTSMNFRTLAGNEIPNSDRSQPNDKLLKNFRENSPQSFSQNAYSARKNETQPNLKFRTNQQTNNLAEPAYQPTQQYSLKNLRGN